MGGSVRMGIWMDGWVDGWTVERWMERWVVDWVGRCVWSIGRVDEWVGKGMGRQACGWVARSSNRPIFACMLGSTPRLQSWGWSGEGSEQRGPGAGSGAGGFDVHVVGRELVGTEAKGGRVGPSGIRECPPPGALSEQGVGRTGVMESPRGGRAVLSW